MCTACRGVLINVICFILTNSVDEVDKYLGSMGNGVSSPRCNYARSSLEDKSKPADL
jgi:hypothetical protein